MALSLVVSEIFNVKKYRDLEIMVRGQSGSLIFDFKNAVTLKTELAVR